jgi:hypothetical protein
MLKYIYEKQEEVPEALKGEYVEKDGKWILQVDGAVAKSVHDEFRNNNIRISRERDEHKKIVDALVEAGLTVDEALRLKGLESDLNEQKLFKKGEIDKIVQERQKDLLSKHEKATTASKKQMDALTRELEIMRIDEAAVAEALKHGLEDTAAEDIKSRARAVFKLIDGKPKALGQDGFELTDDSGAPLTIDKWVPGLKSNYPHLFKRNTGGGGQPGRPGAAAPPGASGKNPWSKDTLNVTEQGRIYKENPQKAEQMRAAAVR